MKQDRNQTFRKRKDGTMELVSEEIVDRPEPEPTEREKAILEAIKNEPADSPVRLLAEALLGKTATEIRSKR